MLGGQKHVVWCPYPDQKQGYLKLRGKFGNSLNLQFGNLREAQYECPTPGQASHNLLPAFFGSQNADPTFHDQQVKNVSEQYQSPVIPSLARDSFMSRNLLQRNR